MKSPDMQQYITLLFSLLTEFLTTQDPIRRRGCPRRYTDASLLVFYAAMALKGITALRAQHRWLVHHPRMLQRFRLPACPSPVTLCRRYQALGSLLQAFAGFVAAHPATQGLGFHALVVYQDKSLFKACGPVWHQNARVKNHIPPGLRNVDKTAAWSSSGYHGWVYGYGLHLTCTRDGFPVLFDVRTANVNERQVLDKKQARLVARGVRCILADKGYTDGARAAAFGAANVVLLTPALSWEQAHTQLGPDALLHPLEVASWQASPQTAIEPVFDLLRRLLGISGLHKPLPVPGIGYVSTFLGLGVLPLQVAMLMNVRHGLPTRALKHLQTVCR